LVAAVFVSDGHGNSIDFPSADLISVDGNAPLKDKNARWAPPSASRDPDMCMDVDFNVEQGNGGSPRLVPPWIGIARVVTSEPYILRGETERSVVPNQEDARRRNCDLEDWLAREKAIHEKIMRIRERKAEINMRNIERRRARGRWFMEEEMDALVKKVENMTLRCDAPE
jgi:hypothetical protein